MAAARDIGRGDGDVIAGATHELYNRYGRQIYAYCLHQLSSREEAEDAVQTTFLNAFRGLQRGTVAHSEQAWLYKIAHNVCLSRQSSSWRRRSVETPNDFEILQEIIPSPPRSEADELIGLEDALEAMPENQRRAILLREWQGLSYREIAAELELSQASVEMLIFRARRSLASALQPAETAEQPLVGPRLDLGALLAGFKSALVGGAAVKVVVAAAAASTVGIAMQPVEHALVRRAAVHRVAAAPVAAVAVPAVAREAAAGLRMDAAVEPAAPRVRARAGAARPAAPAASAAGEGRTSFRLEPGDALAAAAPVSPAPAAAPVQASAVPVPASAAPASSLSTVATAAAPVKANGKSAAVPAARQRLLATTPTPPVPAAPAAPAPAPPAVVPGNNGNGVGLGLGRTKAAVPGNGNGNANGHTSAPVRPAPPAAAQPVQPAPPTAAPPSATTPADPPAPVVGDGNGNGNGHADPPPAPVPAPPAAAPPASPPATPPAPHGNHGNGNGNGNGHGH